MVSAELVWELVRQCSSQIQGYPADKFGVEQRPLDSQYRQLILKPPTISIEEIQEEEEAEYDYLLFDHSALDIQGEIDAKLSVFDNESAELLRRIKYVWINLKDCLERTRNSKTEAEVGRLFHDQVCTAVRGLMSLDHDCALHELEQLSQDFEELSQGMHKLLSRKAETQEALRLALANAKPLPDEAEGAVLLGGEEEEEDVDLLATQVLSCDKTLMCLAEQIGDVMTEQIASAAEREKNLCKISGNDEDDCLAKKRVLRQRAQRIIFEGHRALKEKNEIKLALEEELEEVEIKFSEVDSQSLQAISELDQQIASLANQDMPSLEKELGQCLEKMFRVKEKQLQLDLQKLSVKKIMMSNADLVAQMRVKTQQSIKALEQQSNDLRQRIHAFELAQDRGAAILETCNAILDNLKRKFAANTVRTLHAHHCVDSEIYRHLDSIHRRNVKLRQHLNEKRQEWETRLMLETEAGLASSASNSEAHHNLVAEKARLDAQWEQSRKDCLESIQQVKFFDERCSRTASQILKRCRHFEKISGCDEEDLILTPSAGKHKIWPWHTDDSQGSNDKPVIEPLICASDGSFTDEDYEETEAASNKAHATTGLSDSPDQRSQRPKVPEKFRVHAIGDNMLKRTGSNKIEGNIVSLEEIRARLGLVQADELCWQSSVNVEYAATDASLIIYCKGEDKKAEIVQNHVRVQAKQRYLMRVKGITSESGDAVVGVAVRSTAVGDTIAHEHQRFWGGASGWDDPEPFDSAQERCSGDFADLDQLQIMFEAPENEVSVSIHLLDPQEGQQVHIQTVELLEVWEALICHPRAECQMMWLGVQLEDNERYKKLSEKKIRESLRRRSKLEEIKAQLARKRLTLGADGGSSVTSVRSVSSSTPPSHSGQPISIASERSWSSPSAIVPGSASEYDPTPPHSPRQESFV